MCLQATMIAKLPTMPQRRTGLRFALIAIEHDYHNAAD